MEKSWETNFISSYINGDRISDEDDKLRQLKICEVVSRVGMKISQKKWTRETAATKFMTDDSTN